jgi:hypothetical protein
LPRITRNDDQHAIEAQLVTSAACVDEMRNVDWIECSTEDADAFDGCSHRRSLRRGCRDVRENAM